MPDISELASGNLFVTGELGSGKTMYAVQMIRSYLLAGRPVCTNLNIFLDEMFPKGDNRQTMIRMPDKPTRKHFDELGDAYPMKDDKGRDVYDESRFGLIVLDECLTWLNSRGWQDKERQGVLDWFLHARKHGWNIIFLMQSADYCDPQLRETLLTYHVSCRKLGKYRIPIIGKAFGLRLPKGTMATTTAGYGANAIDFDKEIYRGSDLFTSYQTRQIFTLEQELINGEFVDMRASHTVLSSWHIKGRYQGATIEQKAQGQGVQQLKSELSRLVGWYFIRPLVLLILLPLYPAQVLEAVRLMGEKPQVA
jgi:hypothetical protein